MEDPILEGLWKNVLDAWDDDAVHGKLVGYAQENRRLGEAAALYRRAAEAEGAPYRLNPTQVADAKKRMNGIVMLAVMDLEAAKTEKGAPKGLLWIRVFAVVLFVGAVILLVFLFQK